MARQRRDKLAAHLFEAGYPRWPDWPRLEAATLKPSMRLIDKPLALNPRWIQVTRYYHYYQFNYFLCYYFFTNYMDYCYCGCAIKGICWPIAIEIQTLKLHSGFVSFDTHNQFLHHFSCPSELSYFTHVYASSFMARKLCDACSVVLNLSVLTGRDRLIRLYAPVRHRSRVRITEICVNRTQIDAILFNNRIFCSNRFRLSRAIPVNRAIIKLI